MHGNLTAAALLAALAAAPAAAATPSEATLENYKLHCQQCHMVDGNSPLEPMNLADGKWKHDTSVAALSKVIADGVPGTAMLSFKEKLTPAEIKALAAYVRTFDKKLKAAKPAAKKK
jgi:mono/diheme cytochrome c family protein